MATVENYKDKLLQAFELDRVPNIGIGDVEWEDVLDGIGTKPEDNATEGAEFDVNIDGLANTHNIEKNAVTDHEFKESLVYVSGTEIMEVEVELRTAGGAVVLFISGLWYSNSYSTTGNSDCLARIYYNGVLLWYGDIIQIPTQTGSRVMLPVSEKFFNKTNQTEGDGYLITEKGDLLSTKNGDFLMFHKKGFSIDTYTVQLEYTSTSDGTRGAVKHLSVYAQVLKR